MSTNNAPETKPIPNPVLTNVNPDYAMLSQYLTGESQQNVEFIRNWIMRFSPNERDELLRVNKLANTLQKSAEEYKDPLNMSLRDFARQWANKNMEAMADLMKWLTNLGDYGDYFLDIDNSRQWITGIIKIVVDFIAIFWKNQRAIYIGITLMLIIFFIFIIDTAETSILTSSSSGGASISSTMKMGQSIAKDGIQYMMVPISTIGK